MKAKLRSSFVSVALPDGFSTGGSQMWSDHKIIRRCGCGPIAAYDLLLYLERKHGISNSIPGSRQEYCRELEKLQRKYFPLFYPTGINGLLLVAGINRLFRVRRLPYHAVWAVSGKKLFERAAEMLQQDIPVILAVGPNFPLVWKRKGLNFYQKRYDGRFFRTTSVKSHYVTILEITDDWMKISSWGRSYYMRISEFKDYVNCYSNYIVSNIVFIIQKGTG